MRFVVESVLEGQGDELKERNLGVAVFNRPANFDTNSDTVVRFTAGEVRKRLAAFYSDHGDVRPIHIVLPTGCYAPEFFRHDIDEPQVESSLETTMASRATDVVPTPAQRMPDVQSPRKMAWPVWLGVTFALVLIVCGWMWWEVRNTGLAAFWNGLGPSEEPVMLVPGTVMFAGDPPTVTNADSTHKMVWMSTESAATLTSLGTRFGKDSRAYRIQPVANTTLADLRSHPAVLVGAYNNSWTLRLSSGLPFRFGSADQRAIIDATRPGQSWASVLNADGKRTTDYAIVARYHDPLTENMVVIVAGLNKGGTEAASEFVTESRYFEAANSQLPHGWAKKNIEFVLQTDLIGNTTSAPRVIATKTW